MFSWKLSIKYGVSLLMVFLISIAINLACGPEPDPYDYYVSFFHNDLPKSDDQYQLFYFNGYTFLNGWHSDYDYVDVAEQEVNSREWAKYFHGKTDENSVLKVMYDLSSTADSLYFWYPAKNRSLPDSIRNNSFIKALAADHKAREYFALSKQAEKLTEQTVDEKWHGKEPDLGTIYKAGQQFLELGKKQTTRFLKLRCFYQAQRLFFYSQHNQEALDVYHKYLEPAKTDSHIKSWALSLAAGSEFRLNNNVKAAYLYSKLFVQCPERRVHAYYDFLATKAPVDKVIGLAKSNREKAWIYGIIGFHTPRIGLASLQKVYNVDPHSEAISILLIREINKIEEGYLTQKLNGSKYYGSIGYWDHTKYDSVKASYIKYMPQLKAFCSKLATDGKYPEPAIGYLASAYLSWIGHNPAEGLQTLQSIPENIRPKLNDEKQLINLLLVSQQIKTLDNNTEQQLLPLLTWLDNKVDEENAVKRPQNGWYGVYYKRYYSKSSRDFYEKVLAKMYLKQKDTTMAALCLMHSEKTVVDTSLKETLGANLPSFWQNEIRSKHLNQLLKWRSAKDNPPYLNLLIKCVKKEKRANMIDLLGMIYLREHQYRKAIWALKQVKPIRSVILNYDDTTKVYVHPFADQLHDYPRKYFRNEPWTNLMFAKEMARNERQIKTDPRHAAGCYYTMATGLYNTTYYGSAWYFSAYSSSSLEEGRKPKYYYDYDYMQARTAEKYYLKARSLSKDAEFKAKCTFMAAKYRQKRVSFPLYEDYDDGMAQFKKYEKLRDQSQARTKRNIYFADLKRSYSQTKFLKQATAECSYLRDFLHAKH